MGHAVFARCLGLLCCCPGELRWLGSRVLLFLRPRLFVGPAHNAALGLGADFDAPGTDLGSPGADFGGPGAELGGLQRSFSTGRGAWPGLTEGAPGMGWGRSSTDGRPATRERGRGCLAATSEPTGRHPSEGGGTRYRRVRKPTPHPKEAASGPHHPQGPYHQRALSLRERGRFQGSPGQAPTRPHKKPLWSLFPARRKAGQRLGREARKQRPSTAEAPPQKKD